VGLSHIARLADADTLVTDAGLPRPARDLLEDSVRELVIAPVDAEPDTTGG
jgi:DeoR/GlpR family transcriptional regulator of sugar metabolism